MKTKRKRLAKWPYIFVAPFILTYIAFYMYPMLYSFLISFTDWTAVTLDNRNFVGLKNYIRVFTNDPLFWKSILNTVKNHDHCHAADHCEWSSGGSSHV